MGDSGSTLPGKAAALLPHPLRGRARNLQPYLPSGLLLSSIALLIQLYLGQSWGMKGVGEEWLTEESNRDSFAVVRGGGCFWLGKREL